MKVLSINLKQLNFGENTFRRIVFLRYFFLTIFTIFKVNLQISQVDFFFHDPVYK